MRCETCGAEIREKCADCGRELACGSAAEICDCGRRAIAWKYLTNTMLAEAFAYAKGTTWEEEYDAIKRDGRPPELPAVVG